MRDRKHAVQRNDPTYVWHVLNLCSQLIRADGRAAAATTKQLELIWLSEQPLPNDGYVCSSLIQPLTSRSLFRGNSVLPVLEIAVVSRTGLGGQAA